MLDRSLKIREVDMPYAEREGRSKLKLVSDGLKIPEGDRGSRLPLPP